MNNMDSEKSDRKC